MRKKALLLVVMLVLVALAAPAQGAGGGAPAMSPEEALKLLKDGNERYLNAKPQYPHQTRERRALTAGQGQHPFAAVLSCADSRAPVELLFDQGIGDLFVVRVAGNVAATDEIGSLEYAVDHLGTPLVVVLGHSQCGAVTAVVKNEKVPANVAAMVKPIAPAVAKARADNPGAGAEALVNAAIKANVWQALEDLLQKSPVIKGQVKAGKVKVLGALYELDTGQVQWLGPHPDQDKLVAPAPKGKKGEGQKAPPKEE
jgi:carbonic anhydrase